MLNQTDFLFICANETFKKNIEAVSLDLPMTYQFVTRFDDALKAFDTHKFKVIYFDSDDPELQCPQILEWLETRFILSFFGTLAKISEAKNLQQILQLKVTEFLPADALVDPLVLKKNLAEVLQKYKAYQKLYCYPLSQGKSDFPHWIGQDPRVRLVLENVKQLASLSTPLLIEGASGVGKKKLVSVLQSEMPTKPLLIFDASKTIQIEAQKDAFYALLEQADQTQESLLLIHEIGQMHLRLQEIVANHLMKRTVHNDTVRIVATTTEPLFSLLDQKRIREDIYFLFEAVKIQIPSLGERKDDVALLAEYFLSQLSPECTHYWSNDAIMALKAYHWPGNVVELKEVIAQLLPANPPTLITARFLPQKIVEQSFYRSEEQAGEQLSNYSYFEAKKRALVRFHEDYISEVLDRSQKNLTVAAEKAGMDRSNFKKIIKKYLSE